MKSFEKLKNIENKPQLIPVFKQTERRLLSVFMSALEIIPEFRGAFFERCDYKSGKAGSYFSVMEPEYDLPKSKDVRPDGFVQLTFRKSTWSAFFEAKSEKSNIRADQIQDYCELASHLDVQTIISISNEFSRIPTELPYHLAGNKKRKRSVFHFSWAELRTFLTLFVNENEKINETEKLVLQSCLSFFGAEKSGILTYDAMPPDWAKFVESSGTALGFNTKTAGVTEIVHGWQQERRDLHAKLILHSNTPVELRHGAGARSSVEDRLKFDRKQLADAYQLSTAYLFKETGTRLRVLADLKSCKTSAALEFSGPDSKQSKATMTWLEKILREAAIDADVVSFDWPGRAKDSSFSFVEFMKDPQMAAEGHTSAPKKIRLIHEHHDVRRFKSRTRFIEDLERISLKMLEGARTAKLI